jgi:hypothetical protein
VRRALSLLLLFVVLGASACATKHFETVVEIAASSQPRSCDGRFTVKPLNGWGYRVDACEGPLYFRCFSARHSMGRTQCCARVADEAAAVALVHFEGAQPVTCVPFVD